MTTKTKTAADIWRDIEASAAERNVHETRDARNLCDIPGDVLRQGDIYLVRVPDAWPMGELRGDRQVAVGTSVGSRHVATGDSVRVYAPAKPRVVAGAIVALEHPATQIRDYQIGPVCLADAEWTLTHPEHAHMLCGAGTFQVIYQRDPRMDRAVQD